VLSVLSQANERFERRYELKRRGYDMTRVAERVSGLKLDLLVTVSCLGKKDIMKWLRETMNSKK
jgi:hypothetical protein